MSAYDSKPVPQFDIPFEIRIVSNEERQDCDEVSEVSFEMEDYQSQQIPDPGAEEEMAWGMTTLRLEEHDVWPSDNEGSPRKPVETRNHEDVPHMLALDDEREDSATHLSSTRALFGNDAADVDRHGQPFAI